MWGKVWGTRGHKEGDGLGFLSPEHVPLFKVGDSVHVIEGTGTGHVKMSSVAWFGRVVGMEEGKFLVRNRIQAGRGSPAMIDGQYLILHTFPQFVPNPNPNPDPKPNHDPNPNPSADSNPTTN